MKNNLKNYYPYASLLLSCILFLLIRGIPANAQALRIGAILPLTGTGSDIGEWQKRGIDIAVEEINNKGKMDSRKINVAYEDSKSDPKEGIAAFNKLNSIQKVDVIFSSLTAISNPLVSFADRSKIPMIMIAVSLPDIASRSPWTFRFHVGSEDEAREMASFLHRKKTLKRVAVFYLNDDFGLGAFKVFASELKKYKIKMMWSDSYESNGVDFRSQIAKMKNFKPDGIYVIGYVKASVLLIRQIRELNVDVPLFGNMALSIPNFLQIGGEAMEGMYFTSTTFDPNSENPLTAKFVAMYHKKYGQYPSVFSGFAYDAVRIVSEATNSNILNRDTIRKALNKKKKFKGVMGASTILPNRSIKFQLRIMQLKYDKLVDAK